MLSKWETLFLLLMTIPIMGHVVILPLMIDVAGRDAWISILFSLPFAFLYAYAIFKIKVKYKEYNGSELIKHLFGKTLGYVIVAIYVLYFLFLTIISFAALVDFVYIGFLPETPQIALIIWFFIFFLYAAFKGIKRIALTAGVLAFIAMVTGHTVTLLDSPKKDWAELWPILEFGWSPVVVGTVIIISIWIELVLLLFLPLKNAKEKRLFLLWTIGVLLNGLMMFSTTTGVITIFGLGQADNFIYPAQELVSIISLGFIDRFDIYGMILNTFGTYIRCSLFYRIAYELMKTNETKKFKKRVYNILLITIIFFSVYYLTHEHYRIEKSIDLYAYAIFLYPIPFILLITGYFIGKRNK